MNIKAILGIVGILLLVVALSGCTSNTPSEPTQEVLVGELKVNYMTSSGTGKGEVILPENAKSIRVVYELTGKNNYGYGSNGNIGVTDDMNQGSDPWMGGLVHENKYLEASAGQTIKGEYTFDPAYRFVYSGMFKGKFTVYATVPI